MGYDIRPITEIDTFDFTIVSQEKNTVRKSIDGQLFIVDGNTYTRDEIDVICEGTNWTEQTPI
jgi:hypothetical protein